MVRNTRKRQYCPETQPSLTLYEPKGNLIGSSSSESVVFNWWQYPPPPALTLHLAMSRVNFGCHIWIWGVLLASGGYRPGILLNILQHTTQPLTAKNYLVQNVSSASVEACALDSPCVQMRMLSFQNSLC